MISNISWNQITLYLYLLGDLGYQLNWCFKSAKFCEFKKYIYYFCRKFLAAIASTIIMWSKSPPLDLLKVTKDLWFFVYSQWKYYRMPTLVSYIFCTQISQGCLVVCSWDTSVCNYPASPAINYCLITFLIALTSTYKSDCLFIESLIHFIVSDNAIILVYNMQGLAIAC